MKTNINTYFVTCPHCDKEVHFTIDEVSRNPKAWPEIYDRRTYCPNCGEMIDEYNDNVRFRHIMGDNIMYVFTTDITDPHFSK